MSIIKKRYSEAHDDDDDEGELKERGARKSKSLKSRLGLKVICKM